MAITVLWEQQQDMAEIRRLNSTTSNQEEVSNGRDIFEKWKVQRVPGGRLQEDPNTLRSKDAHPLHFCQKPGLNLLNGTPFENLVKISRPS